jgi:hypothetical protein
MDRLQNYLIYGMPAVHGWLDQYSAEFVASVSAIQRKHSFGGGVGEIGVHHGKLLILLCLAAGKDDSCLAVDVFENQALNLDKSGRGDREVFLRNLEKWCGVPSKLSVIGKSSLDVTSKEILASSGPIRLLSIDGGHTEECVLNDVRLAEEVLSDEGIVIFDDCFNQSWPGVSTGLAKHMMAGAKLKPVAISPNKLYLSRPHLADFYRAELRIVHGRLHDGAQRYFGHDVDIYGCIVAGFSVRRGVRDLVKQTSLGRHLLALKFLLKS